MIRSARITVLATALLAFAACTSGGGAAFGGSTAASGDAPTGTASPAAASASPTAEHPSGAAPGHLGGAHPSAATPAATTRATDEDRDAVPSRVVVPGLGIDLPVISGATVVEGNPPDYPLCDVAQYLTTYRYPARPETTTWLYAHARAGMFLPLLEASTVDDGEALVGQEVVVYSTEPRRYRYRIDRVERHAVTRTLARDVPAGARRLVLQTSEGPRGTVPKLQVGALLEGSQAVPASEAMPAASPSVCYLP